MTVRRARMLGLALPKLARPAGAPLSRHASATCCLVPPLAAAALKWVAMASAMVTKLPLNMLTPDIGLQVLPEDARQACDSTTTALF